VREFMRKLTKEEIQSNCIFIKRTLEYENMTISKKTLIVCQGILEGTINADDAMENIKKKYNLKR